MLAARNEFKNYANTPLYDENIEEKIKIKRDKTLVKHKREKVAFKIACISCIAFLTMTSFLILEGYSSISQSRMNITQLERRRDELEQTKFSMVSELEEAKSSVKISEEAIQKLSMDYASKDQVVYLSLEEAVKAK